MAKKTKLKLKLKPNQLMTVKLFNFYIPVGSGIYYLDDDGQPQAATVKYKAGFLCSGQSVMWLKKVGAYKLDRFITKA